MDREDGNLKPVSYEDADLDRERLFNLCRDVSDKKRPEYTIGSTNALQNFDETAAKLSLTPEQVLLVHADKHFSAIFAHAKMDGIAIAESLEGRFVDAINYLALLYTMMKRRGKI